MNRTRWISGIVTPILVFLLLMFVFTGRETERAGRWLIIYIVVGGIFLVLGLLTLAGCRSEKLSIFKREFVGRTEVQIILAISLLLFATTCLMLAGFQHRVSEFQNNIKVHSK